MSKKEIRKVSFLNWVITLILSAIPGLNIVFFLFTIGCARNPSKKSYAVAALVLSLIAAIAAILMVFVFSDTLVKWANELTNAVSNV